MADHDINAVWFIRLLRGVGIMTAIWGVGMLIANRSSPDPINPAALVLVAGAGVLLFIVSSERGRRWTRL